MKLVNRLLPFADEPPPCWLDDSTAAVPAAAYVGLDGPDGPGGITRGEIDEHDIRQLCWFVVGDHVYVESTDSQDVLDDTDDATTEASHIWWHAIVIEP